MISRLELENVRIFQGGDWQFDLKPLTVFCGANSAGKSTLLKIPLLLHQSQSQKHGKDGRLFLAGSRVDFGDYRTLVSHGEIAKEVVISITTEFPIAQGTIEFLRRPTRSKKSATHENVTKPAALTSKFTFCQAPGPQKPAAIRAQDQPADAMVGALLRDADFRITFESQVLLHWSVQLAGDSDEDADQYEIKLPVDYFKKAGGFRFMSADEKAGYVTFAATLDGLLPFTMVGQARPHRAGDSPQGNSAQPEEIQAPLPPLVQQALWSFQGNLNRTSYLGPLRSPAKRYYVAHLETADDLDATGEFLPYVLRDKGDERVVNVPAGTTKLQRQPLKEALDGWVHYLRTGEGTQQSQLPEEVMLQTTRQVLVQISVKSPSQATGYALADSGFGYSQVLPILVRGLLTDEGSTFIVEQPELHLNPSLQVRLAEFFMSMVRAGKQVLLETHSEHLVNAIRVLAAEDESGTLAQASRIYFIDTSTPRPVLHELSVQKDGTVPEWPRYFFGEAVELTGRLLRAQQRFRAIAREKR